MYLLDPERLRLPPGATRQPTKRTRLPRHRAGEEFLRGPIPLAWLLRACRLSPKALAVALALWFKAGMSKNSPEVVASPGLLRRFGVGARRTQYQPLPTWSGPASSRSIVAVAGTRG
jgi:hypothetical protein